MVATSVQAFAQGKMGTSNASNDVGIVKSLMTKPANSVNFPAQMNNYVQYGMATSDTNAQRSTLEALVGSSVESLSWPDLPRVWWRFEQFETKTDTYYAGINYGVNRVSGSQKNSITYKYNRTISFVLVGSIRNQRKIDPQTTPDGAVSMDALVYDDPVSGMLYPNVRKDYPMVGLCMYDMTRATEVAHSFGFDIWGSGTSHEKSSGFGTPFTLFSNFFQLDPEKPIISHYVLDRCQKMFESAMKKWVEEQFAKAHRAYRTETQSTCKRERGGADRTNVGDRGCFEWFDNLPESVKASTVPRCERGADDLFRCVAKAKTAGVTCPMTQGRDAKIRPSRDFGGYQPTISAPCDENMGLMCVPTLPRENVANLEEGRIFLGIDQLSRLGKCQSVLPEYPRTR